MGRHDEKVVQPLLVGRQDGGGNGRGRGFEAHPQKNHPLVRILLGQVDRIEGRVDDAHIGPFGLLSLQGGTAARHPDEIAEGGHDGVRLSGKGDEGVDLPCAVTQTGQPGRTTG